MKAKQTQIIKDAMVAFLFLLTSIAFSQNVGINTTGNSPDTSAMLDVVSSSKGLLIPRVSLSSLTDAGTIKLPATSLLIYNTNSGISGGLGFYYNSGTTTSAVWTKLVTSGVNNGSTWGINGNSGTDSTTNFVGTTDAKPLTIKTNGSSRVNVSSAGVVTIGDGTNQTKFEVDGTIKFEGTATVWDDVMVAPDATSRGGSNPPVWGGVSSGGTAFKKNGLSQGVFLYMFSPTDEQELYFTVQLPHGYKVGSDIYPHVHWTTSTGTPSGTDVVWGLEYSVTPVGSSYPSTTILTANSVISAIGTPTGTGQHLITSFSPISGSGLGISTVLVCRVFRSATSTSDTFVNEVGILGIDFHIEKDTYGSRIEYVK
ncbi:MAG: hypothetical protein WCO54_10550 [Bacteroidota bacterium]